MVIVVYYGRFSTAQIMGNPQQINLPILDAPEEEEGFVQYEIASFPSDWSLQTYKDKWDREDVFIPKYQRGYLWDRRAASRLVESFLMGLPVPQIFLYETIDRKHEVVDGHQRLKSVFDFMDSRFALKGTNTADLDGKKFRSLNDAQKRTLENATLRAIIVRQLKPDDDSCKFRLFERLNTGGLELKPQEVRHCIYGGPFNEELERLNSDGNWRDILGSKPKDTHKRDIELILRVFALSKVGGFKRPMKDFLSKAMKKHRQATSKEVADFCRDFPECVRIIKETLGNKPFHLRKTIHSAVLDSVLCAVLRHFREGIPDDLQDRYKRFVASGIAEKNSKSDEKAVATRLEQAEKHLFGNAPGK